MSACSAHAEAGDRVRRRVSGRRTIAAMALMRGQDAGDVERHVRTTERSQPADRRAEHEADAERRAEHADQAAAVRSSGAMSATAAWATDKLPPDAPSMIRPANSSHSTPGGTGDEAADRGADQGDDDDRLATDAVRQPTEQRRAQQLGERERGEQQPDGEPEAPNRSA